MTVVVVMGVSGSGKSTVATRLAERLGVPFAEADEFHPRANIEKMEHGTPLTDDDRWPWLHVIARWMGEHPDAVVTCSALKRAYRDLLAEATDVFFLHLAGSRELIGRRIGARTGHFMPAALLDSQFADLEPLGEDEQGVTLSVANDPDEIVDQAVDALRRRQG